MVLSFIITMNLALSVTPTPTNMNQCSDDKLEDMAIVDSVMKNYNRQVLPQKNGVTVAVEITINDISRLSEIDSEFELDLFFSEIWEDPNLNYTHLPSCLSNITLGLQYLNKLWQPNTCIVNSKSAVIHQSPSDNVFLILYQEGRVWRNCRMRVRAPCNIDLKLFPFDSQICTLMFESYSFNSKNVRLEWFKEAPVSFVKKIELPDFLMTSHSPVHARIMYPNGLWDQLSVTFTFERRYGFFILQAYIPTYMTIFVAWINFWMDPKELATRATLSITAFLTMTLQFGNIVQNMPRVSYIKAMDVWMLGGICFLVTALAELAVISYMRRTDRPPPKKKKCIADHTKSKPTHNSASLEPGTRSGQTTGSGPRRRFRMPVPQSNSDDSGSNNHCTRHIGPSRHNKQSKSSLRSGLMNGRVRSASNSYQTQPLLDLNEGESHILRRST